MRWPERGSEEFEDPVVARCAQSSSGHVVEHDLAGWSILWLELRVRDVHDGVHVGAGTPSERGPEGVLIRRW